MYRVLITGVSLFFALYHQPAASAAKVTPVRRVSLELTYDPGVPLSVVRAVETVIETELDRQGTFERIPADRPVTARSTYQLSSRRSLIEQGKETGRPRNRHVLAAERHLLYEVARGVTREKVPSPGVHAMLLRRISRRARAARQHERDSGS